MQIQDFDYSIKQKSVLSSLSMPLSGRTEQGLQHLSSNNATFLHAGLEVA
ncbi:hypothetical protein [Synechocystis sp. PCC 7509]|nr:hypothetical protein [Synechocystis sp. PCC 7509]